MSSRLARRGGVKRISATIYPEIRAAIKQRLKKVGFEVCQKLLGMNTIDLVRFSNKSPSLFSQQARLAAVRLSLFPTLYLC